MSAPALSIVIPAVDDMAALETTLVSVLENRPDDSEIIVSLACRYDDPWNIREEVTFVQAPPGASLVACANLGAAAAAGRVVHVLAAGWRATPGWTDRPVATLLANRAAAVVPLGVSADDAARIVSAGIRVTPGGRRVALAAPRGKRAAGFDPAALVPHGPVLEAGFWRAETLRFAGPGFASVCGDSHADADMAVALAVLGQACAIEPASRVVVGNPRRRPAAFAAGLHAERLFWRSLAGGSIMAALARHAVEVVGDSVRRLPLGALPMLAGRAAAFFSFSEHIPRVRQLRSLVRQLEAESPTLRIDAAHPGISRPRRGAEPARPLRRSA